MTVYAIIADGNVRKDSIYTTKEEAMKKLYEIRENLRKLFTYCDYNFEIEDVKNLDGFWVTIDGEHEESYFVQALEVRKN